MQLHPKSYRFRNMKRRAAPNNIFFEYCNIRKPHRLENIALLFDISGFCGPLFVRQLFGLYMPKTAFVVRAG